MNTIVNLLVWGAVIILVEILLGALKAWLNDTASEANYNKNMTTFMVLNAAHVINSISMILWLVSIVLMLIF